MDTKKCGNNIKESDENEERAGDQIIKYQLIE